MTNGTSDHEGQLDRRQELRLRDAVIGLEATVEEYRSRDNMTALHASAKGRWDHLANSEALKQRVDDLERALDQVYKSTSFRVGNWFVRVATLGQRKAPRSK